MVQMKEQENSPSEMETMLRRFALRESSAGQRQRMLAPAQAAWQDSTIQPVFNPLPFIKALAACVAVILAVDVFGRMALAPWRPHPAFQSSAPSAVDAEDFHALVPSSKLLGGVARDMSQAKKTGLQDYRNHLNRLLDESQTEQPKKQTLPNRHQGQYVPARPLSWHG
jgi:hypothetical protein